MSDYDWVYCDAYATEVRIAECKNCKIKERQMVSNYEECPYYGKFMVRLSEVRI